MNFLRLVDIQSWWEVPSIAYFCSLFRTAFNLLDFDIEELEEALLTDSTEEIANSLLTELIVRLLNGCLDNNDISAFNYQMYLRRLFRQKCQDTGRLNPFNTDIDFQFLPLRTKVEILYALCDFRLDAEDIYDLFKNLEAESLRVEPLGWDDNDSAYWYFYGTRLYREDIIIKTTRKPRKRKSRESRKRGWFYGDDWLDDEESERVWQVVCFTENDWTHLTEKFSKATSKIEKELFRSLSQNFLPEIPRLFQEKERLQRKRLIELAPRRTSSRVLQKIKEKEKEHEPSVHDEKNNERSKQCPQLARDNRAKRRDQLSKKSPDSSDESSESEKEEMLQKVYKRANGTETKTKRSPSPQTIEPPPAPPMKTGRKTNNSLASATGQIVIPDNDEPVSSTRKKLKTSQIFKQSKEDVQIDMFKVLEQLSAHDDAWPFLEPVDEEYAPNYYSVIRRPMDLSKMESKLESGFYTTFDKFKGDFKLIVNNCRLYNGQHSEYTVMVDNLQTAFDRLTKKYIHRVSSSDEEIAVEYQLPTPPRKHKLKISESPAQEKSKMRKLNPDQGEPKSSSADQVDDKKIEEETAEPSEGEPSNKSQIIIEGKKRHKVHRHGKHSKHHKKDHESRNRHKKHAKSKDRHGKKSKKRRSKHHESEPEPVEVINLTRSESQESLESSSRSRSASPLPSIHTPSSSPSPTPSATGMDNRDEHDQREQLEHCDQEGQLTGHSDHQDHGDQLSDPEFYKDKYDKIKERRRHAAKDSWESLFVSKQKAVDKQKQNVRIPDKDKNQKLRETIEKLKAKNEEYESSALFNSLLIKETSRDQSAASNTKDSKDVECLSSRDSAKEEEETDSSDNNEDVTEKLNNKKGVKKNTARNESTSVALEQAVKDISKWLDDAPKGATSSCPPDSPAITISTDDLDNSRHDDESSQGDKPLLTKKEVSRKRPSSREPKLVKRREVQRTIERLQPGKSKGNLLTNITNKNSEKLEESVQTGPFNKTRETDKTEETSPKLSLGSVLPGVEFTLGSDHNFTNDDNSIENSKDTTSTSEIEEQVVEEVKPESKGEDKSQYPTKKDVEVETEPTIPLKPNQEKATPNLSAWFKAFGAPKATPSTIVAKKKSGYHDSEEKPSDKVSLDTKLISIKNTVKFDSPNGPETSGPEGSESPLTHVLTTPRHRRTSTGSSVSERSSFSQDLDSPRHQMSLTSPLLRSPASPRYDDFQKISYPIINGTVRAGFYQDTTSVKSSPEKSCSPREMPQSPYSPYSQHVYISNTAAGSATPNYFVDHNKSPLPTYGQNAPSYYDSSKSPAVSKPIRNHDDYSPLGPEAYQQSPYKGSNSSTTVPYPQVPTKNYSQPNNPSRPNTVMANPMSAPINSDPKATSFPVKKRTYNEPEKLTKKILDVKDIPLPPPKDYQKITQSAHQISAVSSTSVDDIALALSEKCEMAKLNSLRERSIVEYAERHAAENRDVVYETNNNSQVNKNDVSMVESNKCIAIVKKENVDMVNMGYMNTDNDRRNSNEMREVDFAKPNAAINLGINNHPTQKAIAKACIGGSNMTPAHCHDRQLSDMTINHNIAHAHHKQYDASSFSLGDIELANKKLYACNATTSSVAIDYGNWKATNQIRKADMPSDYSNTYSGSNEDKTKTEINVTNTAAINYNKNLQQQQQQYNAYNNVPRASLQRSQDFHQNLPAGIRIPNPRVMHKSDHITVPSAHSDGDSIAKNIDIHGKSQKTDKLVQNHPLASSIQYKTPYSTHSTIPLETLRSIPLPEMLERYANDERYLSSLAATSSLYHDKSFQMFNKTLPSDIIPTSTSVSSIYSQPSLSISKDSNIYKSTSSVASAQVEAKAKTKRKRAVENKSTPIGSSQNYHTPSCSTDMLNPVKSNMLSASAYNFGTSTNMALGGALYGDNGGFSIEDLRNSTSQLMAANYMAAAVAHQQRNPPESNAEKLVKPAHQNSSHSSSSFPYIGHGQVRAGYPFVSAEASQPLYQQYLQRHQEELLRHTGAQIMSLYSPTYPSALGVRPPPYDAINRHSWL